MKIVIENGIKNLLTDSCQLTQDIVDQLDTILNKKDSVFVVVDLNMGRRYYPYPIVRDI